VRIAEQRVAPAAERERAHRHRIGTLMPTMPTSMSNSNWRAVPPSRVKTAVPLANGRVDERDGLVVRRDAHDGEHGTEDSS
jgi:hypothetical protein